MRLHFESHGAGFPIIILHGLFGSGDNWQGFARKVAGQSRYRLILPDLRNHGASPHADTMTYPEMARDVLELMDEQKLPEAHLIGHSMGGKVAMTMALEEPGRVRSLVVVDIAPRKYVRRHDYILDALLSLDLKKFKSRQEIEKELEPFIPELAVRRFLLKGVMADPHGGLKWRMGVTRISSNYGRLGEAVNAAHPYNGPCLFVRGEQSNYIEPGDEALIRGIFPQVQFASISNASHWVHADNPAEFSKCVEGFLEKQALGKDAE